MALGVARLTLDLLLPTGQTRLRKPFARFPGLCNAPIGINMFSIYNGTAIRAILVNITKAFAGDVLLSHTT